MPVDLAAWAWASAGLFLVSLVPCCTRRHRRYPFPDQHVLPLCCPPFPRITRRSKPAWAPSEGVKTVSIDDLDLLKMENGITPPTLSRSPSKEDLGSFRSDTQADEHKGGGLMALLPRVMFALLWGYLFAVLYVFAILANSPERLKIFTSLPKLPASACVDSCSLSDGLTCCTYNQTGLPQEDVWLRVGGLLTHGWWIPAKNESSKLTLLYNHGRGANIASVDAIERYKFLRELDVNVFVYDYPGSGKSEGVATEDSLEKAADKALQYVWERSGQVTKDILVLGRSMGGAIAMHLALDHEFRGVILESTFTDMNEFGRRRAPLTWWAIAWAHLLGSWENIGKMQYIDTCLFMYHSKADQFVPFSQGEQLYDAATNVRPECKVWTEDTTELHDDPMSDNEKAALASWIASFHGPAAGQK